MAALTGSVVGRALAMERCRFPWLQAAAAEVVGCTRSLRQVLPAGRSAARASGRPRRRREPKACLERLAVPLPAAPHGRAPSAAPCALRSSQALTHERFEKSAVSLAWWGAARRPNGVTGHGWRRAAAAAGSMAGFSS
jgi:hypothetical protein